MRDDFPSLLCTKARLGGVRENEDIRDLRRQKFNEDSMGPRRLGMKPKMKRFRDRKVLNEHLNPLKRFLKKQVGRKWNDVYSEIKTANPSDTAVSSHVFEHLFQYVTIDPIIDSETNKVYCREAYGGYRSQIYAGRYYVDTNGFLREPKAKRSRWNYKAPLDKNKVRKINEYVYLLKRESDNTWFEVTYKDVQGTGYSHHTAWFDPGTEYPCQIKGLEIPFLRDKYPAYSRTLSKKDKRKYKL